MGGYWAVSWRMKTEATLQVTTAASTTRMPAISPWPVAPVVMTKVPTSASTRHSTLVGVIFSFRWRAAKMVTPTGVTELTREAIEAPVREIPSWMRKIVRK